MDIGCTMLYHTQQNSRKTEKLNLLIIYHTFASYNIAAREYLWVDVVYSYTYFGGVIVNELLGQFFFFFRFLSFQNMVH